MKRTQSSDDGSVVSAPDTGTPDPGQTPPIEVLEQVIHQLRDTSNIGPTNWSRSLAALRSAIDAARRDNVWGLADVAFSELAAISLEMLVRAGVALRARMAIPDQRLGACEFPDIAQEAARVERIGRFMLDAADQYARIRHVTHIARRSNDAKIVDLDSAREEASASNGRRRSRARAKGEAVEA
jgi:hypothetical protein